MKRSVSVLVAEDERMLRDMLSLELKDAGVTVELASDGEEAISRIDARPPDLLLLDILMPRKNGYEVLQHLQEKRYDFPIVMLTNISTPEEERKCRVLGASDFIVKSNLDVGDLWPKLQKYLG